MTSGLRLTINIRMENPEKPSSPLIVKVKNAKTGEIQDGHIVKVAEAREPFPYLKLEDGTEVTMRTNVVQIFRLIDTWDDNGNPSYNFEISSTITVNSPPELKKSASED